jgi:hypothetical protein
MTCGSWSDRMTRTGATTRRTDVGADALATEQCAFELLTTLHPVEQIAPDGEQRNHPMPSRK